MAKFGQALGTCEAPACGESITASRLPQLPRPPADCSRQNTTRSLPNTESEVAAERMPSVSMMRAVLPRVYQASPALPCSAPAHKRREERGRPLKVSHLWQTQDRLGGCRPSCSGGCTMGVAGRPVGGLPVTTPASSSMSRLSSEPAQERTHLVPARSSSTQNCPHTPAGKAGAAG